MDDYDYTPFEDEPAPRKPHPKGFRLPGGLSLQAAAAILLVAVSLAALYLIFGPSPEEGEVVGPATNTPSAAALSTARTPAPGGALADATRPVIGMATAPAIINPLATSATPAVGLPTAPVGALAVPTAPALGAPTMASAPLGGPLVVDGFARVVGTETFGLRLRFGAGFDTATIRWAEEGETLRVVGGPLSEGDETWWRVQDALGNTGWAAGTYLSPAAAPPAWAPPIASPTHDASAIDVEPPAGAGTGEDAAGATSP